MAEVRIIRIENLSRENVVHRKVAAEERVEIAILMELLEKGNLEERNYLHRFHPLSEDYILQGLRWQQAQPYI